jgi:hypothetical protein
LYQHYKAGWVWGEQDNRRKTQFPKGDLETALTEFPEAALPPTHRAAAILSRLAPICINRFLPCLEKSGLLTYLFDFLATFPAIFAELVGIFLKLR